jgi:hypothetical protein
MSGNMEYYNARNIHDKRSLIPARISLASKDKNGYSDPYCLIGVANPATGEFTEGSKWSEVCGSGEQCKKKKKMNST